MASPRSATAAPRRHTRPAPRSGLALPRRPRKRVRWDRVGRVALLVVLAVVLGLYVQEGLTYLSVRSQADQQAAAVRRLQHQNAGLASEAQSLNDPTTIEREARQLGMVRPGERPYVVIGLPQH